MRNPSRPNLILAMLDELHYEAMVRCPRAGTSDAVQGVTDGGNRGG